MFLNYQSKIFAQQWLHPSFWRLLLVLVFVSGDSLATNVNLAWAASTAGNVGGYRVYYGQNSHVYTASVDVGRSTSYSVHGLQQDATYYFAVSVYDPTRKTESRYSNEVAINAPGSPDVDFTASQASGTAPFDVTLTPSTKGVITGWQWSFGDGTTNSGTSSTVPTAVMSYGNAGTYSVSLTVTGPGGTATHAKSNLITVAMPPPTVNFTASESNGIAPFAVNFTPATTGGITSWQWNFGDGTVQSGTTTTVPAVTKSYGSAGIYTPSLTVTGPGGTAMQTLSNPITITTPPPVSPITPISPVSSVSPIGTTSSVSGLVAAYGFDETIGGTAVPDYSGLRNNGILTGATRVANGRFGNALKFNGTSSSPNWVTVNNAASLALSTGMTLEAWVNPSGWMSGAQTVIMKEGATAEAYLLAANNSTNQPMSAVTTGGEVSVGGNTQIPPNQWTHLATTYDGQNQSLYINGVLVNVMPQTGIPSTSTGALRIGGNSLWGGFYQGYIDEVRIYNRALSNAEIINDSKTPVSVSNPPSLVFGDQNVESTLQSIPSGVAQAFQFTPNQKTKMATGIQLYLDASSTATGLQVGVYLTGADGHPSTMPTGIWWLSSLKAGAWNSLPLPAQDIDVGKTYWIAILGFGGTVQLRVQPGAVSNVVETSPSNKMTYLPYVWPTGGDSASGPVSVYVTGY